MVRELLLGGELGQRDRRPVPARQDDQQTQAEVSVLSELHAPSYVETTVAEIK
jgi:hypothetical protein